MWCAVRKQCVGVCVTGRRGAASMEQFPAFKLVTLLARQVSAPVAARIKEYARGHPWFSRRVCVASGRAFHVAQLRFRLWSLGLRQPRAVAPLTDDNALHLGADILGSRRKSVTTMPLLNNVSAHLPVHVLLTGEAVVFGLGALIIILEVNRQAMKQETKELDAASRWLAVLMQLEELQRELALQQQDMDRLLGDLHRLAPPPPPAPDAPTTAGSPA